MLPIYLLPIVTAKRLGGFGDDEISFEMAEKLLLVGICSRFLDLSPKTLNPGQRKLFERDINEGISKYCPSMSDVSFSFDSIEEEKRGLLNKLIEDLSSQYEQELLDDFMDQLNQED